MKLTWDTLSHDAREYIGARLGFDYETIDRKENELTDLQRSCVNDAIEQEIITDYDQGC